MPPWLSVWIARWLGVEKPRKATPYDYRLWFGVLFLTPVLMVAFERSGNRFFDASTFTLWIFVTVYMLVVLIGCIVWARFVPAMVSLVLAVLAWAALFFFFYPFR
jgi:hypothetical protein